MKEYCNKTLFQAMKFICIFHKLAIEVDEKRQTHRDVHKKYERGVTKTHELTKTRMQHLQEARENTIS